jgi:short-subunit dehydrogenase
MGTGQLQNTGLALVAAGSAVAMAARFARRRRAFSFAGRSVIITGGSRGLGLVLARRLAGEGAHLMLVARDVGELERAAAGIRSQFPSAQVSIAPADVRDAGDVDRTVAETVRRYGGVDVLINNAGVIQVGPMSHMNVGDYEDAMRTHFWGPLFMTLAALPHMRCQGGGRIVNISSIGGRIAVPHLLPYSASKFALVGLSDGLRAELARDNILVTTVSPGLMRTGSPTHAMFKGQHASEFLWFALASSLPVATISAERAARQIIHACRRGDCDLVITSQAKLAVLARTMAPELVGRATSLVNRVLPKAGGADGDVAQAGRVAGKQWSSKGVLAPMYAAARRHNEV